MDPMRTRAAMLPTLLDAGQQGRLQAAGAEEDEMAFTVHDLMIDLPETHDDAQPRPPKPKPPPPSPRPQCAPITAMGPGYLRSARAELAALTVLREQLRRELRAAS
jgi:hypothetical protein